VNERNTEEILEKCINLLPSLKEALKTNYKVWVGLRPYRNKIRVETEQINNSVVSSQILKYTVVSYKHLSFLT